MIEIIKELNIEVSKPNVFQAVVAKQYDMNTRFIKATLVDDGNKIVIVPSGSTKVIINAHRADGESKGFDGVVNEDGTVTVPLHSWMLEFPGTVVCDISVIDTTEGAEKKLTTTSFTLIVEKAALGGGDITSDPQYDVLVKLIDSVAELEGAVGVAVGDYVTLGVDENGDPILWRCVGKRDGLPLMVSDKILTYKAFGANKWYPVYTLPTDPTDKDRVRETYGSNMWSTSALRLWLNAKETPNWTDETKTQKPSANMVTANPYGAQNGFCHGFTDEELAHVKLVRNDTAVNENDESAAYMGHLPHALNVDAYIVNNVKNYFDSAYLQCTHDLFFCLNTVELVEMHKNIDGYTKAQPTEYASAMCDPKYKDGDDNSFYWLRDAYAATEFPECVRCVYPSGREYQYNANNGNIGVRPAFVLAKGGFAHGDGTVSNPYKLTETARKGNKDDTVQNTVTPKRPSELVPIASGVAGVNVGDYIKMGKMDGAPILWRCVDVDVENGKPLFVSDRLLRFFPFSGINKNDPLKNRQGYGTNRWADSAIRHWLNNGDDISWEGHAFTPSSENVEAGYGAYDKEKGFMAESNFTQTELDAISETTIKSALNYNDVAAELGLDTNNAADSAQIAAKTFMKATTAKYGKVTLLWNYNVLASVNAKGLFTATAHPEAYSGESGNNLKIKITVETNTTTGAVNGFIRVYDGETQARAIGLGVIDSKNNLGLRLYSKLVSQGNTPLQLADGTKKFCWLSFCDGATQDAFVNAFNNTGDVAYTYSLSGGCSTVVEETSDKVFLLNYTQLKKIYERFGDYILAKPTEKAIVDCGKRGFPSAFLADCDAGKTWHYWTRDAYSNTYAKEEYYPHYVCDVTTDGRVGQDEAYDGQYGIRPAFYANVANMTIKAGEGDGSEGNPYVVDKGEL